MNQKNCHVSEANGEETLWLELAESWATGMSQTIPVHPMLHSHGEGDSLCTAALQRPCTQLPVQGAPCSICKRSQNDWNREKRLTEGRSTQDGRFTWETGNLSNPPVITTAKEEPDMSCRSKVTVHT